MYKIISYTDGSCQVEKKTGGWGCYFFYENEPRLLYTLSGFENNTTNNKMELRAIYEILNNVPSGEIYIYTDSKYCVGGIVSNSEGKISNEKDIDGWMRGWIKNNWKKSDGGSVLNKNDWSGIRDQIIRHLSLGSKLYFKWVPRNQNVKADELSRKYLE